MNTWKTRRRWGGRTEEQRIAFLRKMLRQPGARLILEHRGRQGHQYCIEPRGVRVTDDEVQTLARRRLIRVLNPGLFPDQPQSWTAN
jgi:hypothetical protein